MLNWLKIKKSNVVDSESKGKILEEEIHIKGTILRSGSVTSAGVVSCSELVFILEEMPKMVFSLQSWATGNARIALAEKGDKVSFMYHKEMNKITLESFINHSFLQEIK